MDKRSRTARYGRLTTDVMESRLSAKAKLLAAVIDWHLPHPSPSTARLAALLGCSHRAVRYYRRELLTFIESGCVIGGWERERQRVAAKQHSFRDSIAISIRSSNSEREEKSISLKEVCYAATDCRPLPFVTSAVGGNPPRPEGER